MTLSSITKTDFQHAIEKFIYYDPCRWEYYNLALELVGNPVSVVELGPHQLPLFPDGDTIDSNTRLGPTYCHDASMIPWPIQRHYDLFIGLQVWEHLGESQVEAFFVVMRIADRAVLSFPYKWNCPGNKHHGIDDEIIDRWSHGLRPSNIIKTTHRPIRIIYYWEF